MRDFKVSQINTSLVNEYLFFKNLEINRKYSSNKKKINKLDHYLWWFQKQKHRHSFLINKNREPIFISTSDHTKLNKLKIIYSGLISCQNETNLFDLLKAIKIQNIYLDKLKNYYCFISIDKKNKVLLQHWKYFGYKKLFNKQKLYISIKKLLKISSGFNIYYKKN
jgi:hypothetical protein